MNDDQDASFPRRPDDPPPSLPSNVACLRDLPEEEWRDAWLAVLQYALAITRSLDAAQEARQEAYKLLLTTRPWVPDRVQSFRVHMLRTTNSVIRLGWKYDARRREIESRWANDLAAQSGGAAPSAQVLHLHEAERRRKQAEAARVLELLRGKLAPHPLALRILDRMAAGAEGEKAEAQARALGVCVEDVYRERARMKRFLKGIYGVEQPEDGQGKEDKDEEEEENV